MVKISIGICLFVFVSAAQAQTIQQTGPEQIVFQWSTQRCEDLDIPDLPARAFRDVAGQIQLIASHYVVRRFIGPTLDTLVHQCVPVFTSTPVSDPSQFHGYQWISSTYTLDGATIYALVHNEHHGALYGSTSCPSGDAGRCWYNAIDWMRSFDGGFTYSGGIAKDGSALPGKFVATIPSQYIPDGGPMGYFTPSNIVQRNGYYYSIFMAIDPSGVNQRVCVMRTATLSDPASWRAWDGTSFSLSNHSPYLTGKGITPSLPCVGINTQMVESVTWNTVLGKYLLLGHTWAPGGQSAGVYASTSDDLVTWTPRVLALQVTPTWAWQCGDPDPYAYPSILDPADVSRNFEVSGGDLWLYLTRFHPDGCQLGLNRDLVRIPLRIEP
jgi:hypothetical protein